MLVFITDELYSNPKFYKIIQEHFRKSANFSTFPRKPKALNPTHEFFRVKNIVGKPINSFNDDLWIYIEQAQKQQLINVTIEVPEKERKDMLDKLIDLYTTTNGPIKQTSF